MKVISLVGGDSHTDSPGRYLLRTAGVRAGLGGGDVVLGIWRSIQRWHDLG